jgi:hypothetical protein
MSRVGREGRGGPRHVTIARMRIATHCLTLAQRKRLQIGAAVTLATIMALLSFAPVTAGPLEDAVACVCKRRQRNRRAASSAAR